MLHAERAPAPGETALTPDMLVAARRAEAASAEFAHSGYRTISLISSLDDIVAFLRPRIANYKIPRTITFQASLPREESGKIFKRRLRDPFWEAKGRRI